jgi:hypothetical protein
MQEEAMTNAMLIIPAQGGLSPSAVHCLISTLANKPPGLNLGYNMPEETAIDRVRSMAATTFLGTEGDVLVFIDSDIIHVAEYVYQLIEDCLQTRSVVIGPYIKKHFPADDLALAPFEGNVSFDIGPTGGMTEIKWGATGFMAIHRSVLEGLAKVLPRCNQGSGFEVIPFFMPMVLESDPALGPCYMSEDFAFCQRCQEAGFKIWADTKMVLGHLGKWMYVVGQAMPEKVKEIDK